MKENVISIVLLGDNTSINQTIMEIIREQEDMSVERWPVNTLENQLKNRDNGEIDILVLDLLTISRNIIKMIEYLAEKQIFNSILAIHIYKNKRLVTPLLKAGATGYLQADTGEEEILKAVTSLKRGETYIGI